MLVGKTIGIVPRNIRAMNGNDIGKTSQLFYDIGDNAIWENEMGMVKIKFLFLDKFIGPRDSSKYITEHLGRVADRFLRPDARHPMDIYAFHRFRLFKPSKFHGD